MRRSLVAALTGAAFLSACASGPVYYGPLGPPRFAPDAPRQQCVPFARAGSGLRIYGDAHTWWRQAAGVYPQSRLPAVGSVLVLRIAADGSRGHLAVVREIVDEKTLLVDHANWHGREEVALSVPVRDVSPRGEEWTQVRVWWLDTNGWGSKSYQVEGFIYPR